MRQKDIARLNMVTIQNLSVAGSIGKPPAAGDGIWA